MALLRLLPLHWQEAWLRHKQLIAYLIVVLALLFVVIRLELLARGTREALCELKMDLEQRRDNTQLLLDQSEGPIIRAYGLSIPRSVLESNVRQQNLSLDSLAKLEC